MKLILSVFFPGQQSALYPFLAVGLDLQRRASDERRFGKSDSGADHIRQQDRCDQTIAGRNRDWARCGV